MLLLAPLLLSAFLTQTVAQDTPPVRPAVGAWHAWLDSPGGELPFELELRETDGKWQALVTNGAEQQGVPLSKFENGELTLRFGHYDATIQARVAEDGRRLDGEWKKRRSADEYATLPFHAVQGSVPRFGGGDAAAAQALDGRWAAFFESQPQPAVALFSPQPDGEVWGTFLTTTGDYRYLAGSFDGERLRLSCFDGAHAFLFDARLGKEGGLAGDFWSGDRSHDAWRAKKSPEAKLPDAQSLLHPRPGARFDQLSAIGVDGRLYSFAEPSFAGKVRLVTLFGSWCPNCHDEAALLVELDKKYRSRGLLILGLAFEVTGDVERDLKQVRGFAARHGIEFPLLLAGKADKEIAARCFPLFDKIEAFPTTVFLDADGMQRAAWTGYSGPATGSEHAALRARFEALIEKLLATEVPNATETWALLRGVSWLRYGADTGLGLSFLDGPQGQPVVHERVYGRAPDQPTLEEGESLSLLEERVVEIAVSNTAVSWGERSFTIDRAAQVLVSPWDCGDRLAPNGLSCAPLLDPSQLRTPEGMPNALKHESPLVRREALAALALDARPEMQALGSLALPLLRDLLPDVRAQACWAVGRLGLVAARPLLVANLAHTSPAVRREALRALQHLYPGEPEIEKYVEGLRQDVDPMVRKVAGGVSGAFAERAAPVSIPFERK
jgi:thiol-disulfide isomerase/thioredoxin